MGLGSWVEISKGKMGKSAAGQGRWVSGFLDGKTDWKNKGGLISSSWVQETNNDWFLMKIFKFFNGRNQKTANRVKKNKENSRERGRRRCYLSVRRLTSLCT